MNIGRIHVKGTGAWVDLEVLLADEIGASGFTTDISYKLQNQGALFMFCEATAQPAGIEGFIVQPGETIQFIKGAGNFYIFVEEGMSLTVSVAEVA
jgi:hypothetical protein